MRILEFIYYETLPFTYLLLSVYAFFQRGDSRIATFGSILLFVTSLVIIYRRYQHRSFKGRGTLIVRRQ